jgi:hypothetical protein
MMGSLVSGEKSTATTVPYTRLEFYILPGAPTGATHVVTGQLVGDLARLDVPDANGAIR